MDGFRRRHGDLAVDSDGGILLLTGADGARAQLHPPPGARPVAELAEFVAEVRAPRRLGLLLARRSAAAVGVAFADRLETSKVDSWYVQGRTAAGGRSQRRFANRRENQAAAAARRAADIAARLLLPADGLAAVVTGGDRPTVAAILSDPRLAPVVQRRAQRHLDVATPNLAVLREAVGRARTVAVRLPDEPSE